MFINYRVPVNSILISDFRGTFAIYKLILIKVDKLHFFFQLVFNLLLILYRMVQLNGRKIAQF